MDLNLLRVFIAIFESGSLTRAAERLHVTQPAVSQALKRLRGEVGEELFIRSAGSMVPTPFATQIYPEISSSLERINHAMIAIKEFDAKATRLEFRLALSELGEATYLSPITAMIRAAAPHATIRVVPLRIGSAESLLQAGVVDVLVTSEPYMDGFDSDVLKLEEYVVLMSDQNVLTRSPQLSLADYLNSEQVIVSGDTARPNLDLTLKRLGHSLRVALVHNRFASLPHVLTATDLVATVPVTVAEAWARSWPLAVRDLPIHVDPVPVRLYTRRIGIEGAHIRWLRKTVLRALEGAMVPNIAIVPPESLDLRPAVSTQLD